MSFELDENPAGRERAQLIDCRCLLQNIKAPFSAVTKGELVLRGSLLPANLGGRQLLEIESDSFEYNSDSLSVHIQDLGDRRDTEIYCLWMFSRKSSELALVVKKKLGSSVYHQINVFSF
jgi:hypothetical protein